MIVKNILIEHKNKELRIEISDANFLKNEMEKDISMFFDKFIEECVKTETFERLVK